MILMTRGSFLHILRAIGVAVTLTAVLSGCGAGSFGGSSGKSNSAQSTKKDKSGKGVFDPKSTMAAIQKRDKLNVGIEYDLPPFSSANTVTGSPEGFDVDLVKWIATGIFGKNIENKITYIELDPRDRELALEQNKVDIVVGRYDINAARKRFVDFAGPYYITHQAIVIANNRNTRGTAVINSVFGLNKKKVCTVRGSTDVDALLSIAPTVDASIQKEKVTDCAALLADQQVSAIAGDSADLRDFIVNSGSDVKVLDASYGALPYGVGIKKGVDDLRKYVNDRISLWKDYDDSQELWLKGIPGNTSQPRVDRY